MCKGEIAQGSPKKWSGLEEYCGSIEQSVLEEFIGYKRKESYNKNGEFVELLVDSEGNRIYAEQLEADCNEVLGHLKTKFSEWARDKTEKEKELIEFRKLNEIRKLFSTWIGSIESCNDNEYAFGNKDNEYLSFNYTDTLEQFFSVPKEKVNHIHGNGNDPNSEIYFGGKSRTLTPFNECKGLSAVESYAYAVPTEDGSTEVVYLPIESLRFI